MNNILEKADHYKKHLVTVSFENVQYYCILAGGEEAGDNEGAPGVLLVDADKKILLFKTLSLVPEEMNGDDSPADKERFHNWAKECADSGYELSGTFSFDVLVQDSNAVLSVDVMKQICNTLGVIWSYAMQVDDAELIDYLDGEVISEFLNIVTELTMSDIQKPWPVDYDFKPLVAALLEMAVYMRNKLRVY